MFVNIQWIAKILTFFSRVIEGNEALQAMNLVADIDINNAYMKPQLLQQLQYLVSNPSAGIPLAPSGAVPHQCLTLSAMCPAHIPSFFHPTINRMSLLHLLKLPSLDFF